jgi:predicted TIM-barrel fold metal-dependent hydrolase
MQRGKIDTHHHFFPAVYVDAVGWELLAAVMPGGKPPTWSAQAALEMMEENGIETAILSISAGPSLPKAGQLLRSCNEAAADLRRVYPGRFGSFASLPLPDLDASLREIEFASERLGVHGFILFTSYGGRYLGDPYFAPILEELDRRGAVVFVHPNMPGYELPGVAPASVLEFPFETTRTATSLLMAGVPSRLRRLRFILSHAGGALPSLAPRIALSLTMMPGLVEQFGDPLVGMRSFYYDTALSAGISTLSALCQLTDPDHILFGTDFPFAPNWAIRSFGETLDSLAVTGFDRESVYRGNAARLLDLDTREIPTMGRGGG